MIIAIDGPSGTGKSTVAKGVAKALQFTYFDTGAMYRSLAWWLVKLGVNLDLETEVTSHLSSFKFEIKDTPVERGYFVAGTDVTEAIRSAEISLYASKIAIYPLVRQLFVQIQRNFGISTNAVFEGRDMGTVVFPHADLKIFLTAESNVRAQRRYLELSAKNPALTFSQEQILHELESRDLTDSTRLVSPLRQASDAILMDTSLLTAAEVIDQIVELIEKKK